MQEVFGVCVDTSWETIKKDFYVYKLLQALKILKSK